MRRFFSYFKSKQFLINILLALLVVAGLFFGTLKWLSAYTNHGEYVVVPDFIGQQISMLDEFTGDKEVSYEIIDSVYIPSEKPGMVLRQDPDPATKVKHNRTVYLYVTGMVPPQIEMPDLIYRSERQARLIIVTYGLKVGKVREQEADCNGCVLAQELNGKTIEAGATVQKGKSIDLVVGRKDAYIGQRDNDTTSVK